MVIQSTLSTLEKVTQRKQQHSAFQTVQKSNFSTMDTHGSHAVSYPHKVLTKIIGKPTAEDIKTLKKQIYANARAAHSTRGGGQHGHLGVLLSNAAYANKTKSTTAWTDPQHPGANPTHARNATADAITEGNRKFKAELAEFNLCEQVKGDLRQMMLQAVNPTYTTVLEDPEMGYADVKPIDLLDHLVDEYGTISEMDLENNRDKLSEAWDPTDDFETIVTRIRDVKLFAKAGEEEVTDNQALRLTIAMFERENIFEQDVDDWHRLKKAEKTMEKFKDMFRAASKAYGRKMTTKKAGFDGAALAATQVPVCLPTNSKAPRVEVDSYPLFYCWSHGLGPSKFHTSLTCRKKKEGHQDAATITNMMGGSNRFFPPTRQTTEANNTNGNNE